MWNSKRKKDLEGEDNNEEGLKGISRRKGLEFRENSRRRGGPLLREERSLLMQKLEGVDGVSKKKGVR